MQHAACSMQARSSPAPCMYVQSNDLLNASPKHTNHHGLQACLSRLRRMYHMLKKNGIHSNHDPTPPIPDDLPSGKPLSHNDRGNPPVTNPSETASQIQCHRDGLISDRLSRLPGRFRTGWPSPPPPDGNGAPNQRLRSQPKAPNKANICK